MKSCERCGAAMDADERACPNCGHDWGEPPLAQFHAAATREDLLALGLSPALVEFVLAEPRPKPFSSLCEPRDCGWACVLPEDTSVYVLWTRNGDVTAALARGGSVSFALLRHDDPTIEPLADTEQGLLARLFLDLLESPRATPEGLRRAAESVGFRHLGELAAWHGRYGSAADFQERFDQFVRDVDGGSLKKASRP